MKTTTFLVLVGGLLVCSSSTQARVGETEAQIDHRYGKPAGKWDDFVGYKKLYHWHGFDAIVTFVDGVSQREMFNKTDGFIDPHDQKYILKVGGADRNGIIFDKESGLVLTTKEFAEKYKAAREAAFAKSNDKQ